MCEDINKILKDEEYINLIRDLLENKMVQEMKKYKQHFNVTRFNHCLLVSYNSYLMCKKKKLDYKSAARAGLLHDLFLYDWHKRENGRKGFHAFTHSKTALQNAMKITNLNDIEKDMIIKHMWPVTWQLPKYKETFIITFVDKYFAFNEKNIKNNYFDKKDVI